MYVDIICKFSVLVFHIVLVVSANCVERERERERERKRERENLPLMVPTT